jgi:hypothetical protein
MSICAIVPGSRWVRTFGIGAGTNEYQPPPWHPPIYKSKINVGERFNVWVQIRNLSTNKTISCIDGGTWQDEGNGLFCVVVSPSGKDISPSRSQFMAGSAFITSAPPTETMEFEFAFSDLCRLEEAGSYKITTRKRLIDGTTLTSNTLRLSVTSAKGKAGH